MTKQKQSNIKLLIPALGFVLMLILPASAAASAKATKTTSSGSDTTSSENISQAVTQSYNAGSAVELGMIVQLEPKDPTTVEPLSPNDISDMLGIVVSPNAASVTLTPISSSEQQVFVATAGRYDVLVSNQDGPIVPGDLITISSLAGIGMEANANQTIVLGKAAGSFNGTTNVVSTEQLKDSQGGTVKVTLGEIPIDLDIAHNPLQSKETDYIPGFLARAATAVTNRPVSAARIYLGMLTLLVSAILTASLLYSGVRSGMQAIGRNPLSRKSIIRSLIQTVVAGLIIFVVGIFAVYLLLKL
jgi:hypothetical protein